MSTIPLPTIMALEEYFFCRRIIHNGPLVKQWQDQSKDEATWEDVLLI